MPAVLFMAVGFLFTGFLWAIRTRFPLWPFHPAGYATRQQSLDLWLGMVFGIYQLGGKSNGTEGRWDSALSEDTAFFLGVAIRRISGRWRLGAYPCVLGN